MIIMISSFWLNNFHFAFEFFAAIVLFAACWLALDAFYLKRDFKTLLRAVGFGFLASWQIIHALDVKSDLGLGLGVFFYLAGLVIIGLNLWLEKPPPRPKLGAVIVLPAIIGLMWQVNIFAAILSMGISYLAWQRFKAELNKSLQPFFIAFGLFSLSAILAIFNSRSPELGFGFILEHLIKIVGVYYLARWVWQYLQLRLKQQLFLTFITVDLFIAVIVTFSFSAILLNQIKQNLALNLKQNLLTFNYALEGLKSDSMSKAELVSQDETLKRALLRNDFVALQNFGQQKLNDLNLGFITFADPAGRVLLRAHNVLSRGDSVLKEKAAARALSGESAFDIESAKPEGVSLRAASPIYSGKIIIGVVILGYPLDNFFLDQIKKLTGMELAIFDDNKLNATTFFPQDEKQSVIGSSFSDQKISYEVLTKSNVFVGQATLAGRQFLGAFAPLKSTSGINVGMIMTGRSEIDVGKTAVATNRLTLLTTIIILMITLLPAMQIINKIISQI